MGMGVGTVHNQFKRWSKEIISKDIDSYRIPGDIQLKIIHKLEIYTLKEGTRDGVIGKEKPGILELQKEEFTSIS